MNRRDFLVSSSLLAGASLLPRPAFSESTARPPRPGDKLAAAWRDLDLPAWGPYTKEFAGISHLPDLDRGLRFDLSVFPALYRRRQVVPSVVADTGVYAWSADPALRTYTLRHVLGDVRTFYADLTYAGHEDGGRIIRARFVNQTSLPQQASLHFLGSLHFPEIGPYRQPAIHPAKVTLPPGGGWIDGSHYQQLVLDEDSPLRHLPDNAEIWGEVRGDGFVNGVALGKGFGSRPGDQAVYALPAGFDATDTVALLRHRLAPGARVTVRVTGAYAGELTLEGSGELRLAELPAGDPSLNWFKLEPAGGELLVDGCVLVRRDQRDAVQFAVPPLDCRPEIGRRENESALTLKYAPLAGCYGLAWEQGDSEVREWLSDNLERDFALFTHEHVKTKFELGGSQHYTNVFVRPVFLAPGETRDVHAFVCHEATPGKASARLAEFHRRLDFFKQSLEATVRGASALPDHTEPGRAYAHGIERMSATVATNIVYPVRRFGKFTRHYCPGRWWDSLYTWDSGFIGLGLLELDPARSIDNLAAYLTEPGADCAFVHHGSPVPVQIYQLQGIWNRTRDLGVLRRFFPGARRMHRFLTGRGDGSTTCTLSSGLLRTWDYFYNSGGWDDYPPQKFLRGTPLTKTTTPVINTAQAIRTARLLREMAVLLDELTGEFDDDIAGFTEALQKHSWNPATGWFSYVHHDDAGRPAGPLLHKSGADFNRGLDGIQPLIAGACTPEQEELFIKRLRDESIFWTRCGLSTVDQSAPYFRTDGYWNGAVWMPHQWFVWKTLLDLGQGDLAWRIARTALETWEKEVRATGCCFEHFIIQTGRGAGWHQFGGLSSPVIGWFAAYFRPGTLTGGLDCWVLEQKTNGATLRARLRLSGRSAKKPVLLAVVPNAGTQSVRWRGAPVPAIMRQAGTLEITLPAGDGEGELVVG